MSPLIHERLSTITPLGIRFWDEVTDTQSTSPLVVRAFRESNLRQAVVGKISASGIYVFNNMPGLRNFEYPYAGSEAIPDESVRYLVYVQDPSGSYQAMVFAVDLPLPYRGYFPVNPSIEDDEDKAPGVYLFSAPTRSVPIEMAVIYAHIVQEDSDKPAAYALVDATVNTKIWTGIADKNGIVALLIPYPTFTLSNFNGEGPQAQTWSITVGIRHQPDVLEFPLQALGIETPNLKSLVLQEAAEIWTTEGGGNTTTTLNLSLGFNKKLILQSGAKSPLRITSATS